MSDALYAYYESELVFIRQLAQEFAKKYPAAAQRLLLDPNRSVDPHVERLIEAFALLTARVQHKLDDEFPELTEALLGVLYPHYLAPIPAMAVIQFEADPARTQLAEGFPIPASSKLHTQAVGDLPCRFRTCYPVTLWPVVLSSAQLVPPPFPSGWNPPPRTAAAIRLQLECQGELTFADLSLDRLRFHLLGDNQLISTLYELIFNHTTQVLYRPLDRGAEAQPIVLTPGEALAQVGFERDEGVLPFPSRSFLGYRLLTEFFALPPKFLFVDVCRLQRACKAGFRERMEVVLFLNRTIQAVEQNLETDTFRLGCTPVVNLFDQIAEPVHLTHSRYEYHVTPDVAHPFGMEVYSIDEVASADPATSETTVYQPFYSFRHGVTRENQRTFWFATRKPSLREGDRGTEVYLNLTDLAFEPRVPAESVLVVRTTCTNRELAAKLQPAEAVYFELEAAAPLNRIRCLRPPTTPLRAPLRRGAHWRLLSHLNLNHLSLTDHDEGRHALQEILRLYDFSDAEAGQQLAAVNRQLIDGILAVSSRRVVGRVGGETAAGFCRGVEVTIEFDEQKYLGSGVFLFACVLERFLALYASINSFSQLIAKIKQSEDVLKRWRPRTGELQLL
jgi:type VI secretion system protein ImpG